MQDLKKRESVILKDFVRHKAFLVVVILIILASVIFVVREGIIVDRAHDAFESYYAFRGCAQLLEKTDAYGTCRTTSGDIIKIVKFRDQWYLDGDLPMCWKNICL